MSEQAVCNLVGIITTLRHFNIRSQLMLTQTFLQSSFEVNAKRTLPGVQPWF